MNLRVFLSAAIVFSILEAQIPAQASQPASVHLPGLVAAEYAFARKAEKEGVKAAFMAFFHTDAIMYGPGPFNGPRVYGEGPDGKGEYQLDWYPSVADVSASGDLGYTSGPSQHRPKPGAEVIHGFYFSIWRRDGGGPWLHYLDFGIAPIADPAAAKTKIPALRETTANPPVLSPDSGPVASPELVKLDSAFAKKAAESYLGAYEEILLPAARLHRRRPDNRGLDPIVGWEKIKPFLSALPRTEIAWNPEVSIMSRSGDMGMTRGTITRKADGKTTRATYVRLWRRASPKDAWKIAVDAERALPD